MSMSITITVAICLFHLSLLSYTVWSEDTDAFSLLPPPHHPHHITHATAPAPHHHPGHHHHHHHLSPATAPSPHHSGGHHHHLAHPPTTHIPPAHAPTKSPPMPHPKPPVQPPVKPPVHPPTKPPVHPLTPPHHPVPRSLVAVQGVVYCKSCRFAGFDTLLGASPLSGATVKLQCYNTKYKMGANATTDKNGYFFFEAPKTITSYGAHKCKVGLVSSTNSTCAKPSNLHGGVTGGALRPEKAYSVNKVPFILYTVGPFAFEPKCPR